MNQNWNLSSAYAFTWSACIGLLIMAMRRRDFLAGTAILVLSSMKSRATVISGGLPWTPNAGSPPVPVRPGPWHYFTADEGRAVEALADRIIPPDPQTPGGKDAGCAVFIDRQLAGPYGRAEGHYTRPPFMPGTKQQGPQSADGPAATYRKALAALDRLLPVEPIRASASPILPTSKRTNCSRASRTARQNSKASTANPSSTLVIKDMQEGFFADPLYGGNRDMVAWKMIGYPGARYNYLDWVERHNERFPLPPVSITGRADWTPKT